ncbi:hypothetical protein PQX77_019202 [Marasmius sp. AFHP31]|nr:hypothetical protein PQX77_019202 [Marasmius sp. AFHP31]
MSKRPAPENDSSPERQVRPKIEVKVEEDVPRWKFMRKAADVDTRLQDLQKRSKELQEMNEKHLKNISDASSTLVQERSNALEEIRTLKTENEKLREEIRAYNEKMKALEERVAATDTIKSGFDTLKKELEDLKGWKQKVEKLKGGLDELFKSGSADNLGSNEVQETPARSQGTNPGSRAPESQPAKGPTSTLPNPASNLQTTPEQLRHQVGPPPSPWVSGPGWPRPPGTRGSAPPRGAVVHPGVSTKVLCVDMDSA